MAGRRRMGVMLQVSSVPETLTVREHLHLFSRLLPGAAAAAGRSSPSPGLEAVADRRFGKLSGGQQQRVLFALAICGNPELLFLDEPTVGMDVESRRLFWQTVRALAAVGPRHPADDALSRGGRCAGDARRRAQPRPDHRRRRRRPRSRRAAADRQVTCRTQPAARRAAALPGVDPRRGAGRRRAADHDRRRGHGARAARRSDATVSGLEVRSAGLEEAFLALTGADAPRAVA